MSGSYYALNTKYNSLEAQIRGLTASSASYPPAVDVVTTNTAQTISAVKTFTALPQSAITPSNADDLVNKTYADSLVPTPINAVLINGTQTLGTGIKTFTNLPQSSTVPLVGDDLVNKTYVDGAIPPPLDAVLINGSQTLGTGIKTFTNLPQSSTVPLVGNDLVNKTYVDGAIPPPLDAVLINGSQTLGTGIKTFTNLPQSSTVPLVGNDLVNKTYVDGAIPSPSGLEQVLLVNNQAQNSIQLVNDLSMVTLVTEYTYNGFTATNSSGTPIYTNTTTAGSIDLQTDTGSVTTVAPNNIVVTDATLTSTLTGTSLTVNNSSSSFSSVLDATTLVVTDDGGGYANLNSGGLQFSTPGATAIGNYSYETASVAISGQSTSMAIDAVTIRVNDDIGLLSSTALSYNNGSGAINATYEKIIHSANAYPVATPSLTDVLISGNSAGSTNIDMNQNSVTQCYKVSNTDGDLFIDSGTHTFYLRNDNAVGMVMPNGVPVCDFGNNPTTSAYTVDVSSNNNVLPSVYQIKNFLTAKTASTATQVTTSTTSSNTTFYLPMLSTYNASVSQTLYTDVSGHVTYNPFTNQLTTNGTVVSNGYTMNGSASQLLINNASAVTPAISAPNALLISFPSANVTATTFTGSANITNAVNNYTFVATTLTLNFSTLTFKNFYNSTAITTAITQSAISFSNAVAGGSYMVYITTGVGGSFTFNTGISTVKTTFSTAFTVPASSFAVMSIYYINSVYVVGINILT